jgi:hypothetical protein
VAFAGGTTAARPIHQRLDGAFFFSSFGVSCIASCIFSLMLTHP